MVFKDYPAWVRVRALVNRVDQKGLEDNYGDLPNMPLMALFNFNQSFEGRKFWDNVSELKAREFTREDPMYSGMSIWHDKERDYYVVKMDHAPEKRVIFTSYEEFKKLGLEGMIINDTHDGPSHSFLFHLDFLNRSNMSVHEDFMNWAKHHILLQLPAGDGMAKFVFRIPDQTPMWPTIWETFQRYVDVAGWLRGGIEGRVTPESILSMTLYGWPEFNSVVVPAYLNSVRLLTTYKLNPAEFFLKWAKAMPYSTKGDQTVADWYFKRNGYCTEKEFIQKYQFCRVDKIWKEAMNLEPGKPPVKESWQSKLCFSYRRFLDNFRDHINKLQLKANHDESRLQKQEVPQHGGIKAAGSGLHSGDQRPHFTKLDHGNQEELEIRETRIALPEAAIPSRHPAAVQMPRNYLGTGKCSQVPAES